MYGPERRGAPVVSFVRISDERVEGRGPIVRPDAVVLADPTVLDSKVFPATAGLRSGAVVVANAPAEGPVSGLPQGSIRVDVSAISARHLRKGNVSSGIAAATCKVLGIAGRESVRRAVETEMEEIGLDAESIKDNVMAADECFSLAPKAGPIAPQDDHEDAAMVELRAPAAVLAAISLITKTGNSSVNRTGDWRTSRPVIDYAKCTKCMICYVYCPDSSITLESDLTPRVNYDNCKGCLICAEECPLKAISEEMVRA